MSKLELLKKLKGTRLILADVEYFDSKSIKNLRTSFNMTQSAFADALGVKTVTVEKWESGENQPRDVIKKLLFLLDRNPDLINQLYAFVDEGKFVKSTYIDLDDVFSHTSKYIYAKEEKETYNYGQTSYAFTA